MALSPSLFFSVIILYFIFLLTISYFTSKNSSNQTYFNGNKQSLWYLVAFGMLSDSLSGVTYISVPGAVLNSSLTYLQVVFGYFLGYFVIIYVLLPLYYRLNLISIYTYLRQRFGINAQKTGSFYFLLSRLLGAGGRLMLAIGVMQLFIFNHYNIPFALTTTVFIGLMLIYTYKGGIRTLVFTDAFQSLFLILGVCLSIYAIADQLNFGFSDIINTIETSKYNKLIETDILLKNHWLKHVLGGAFFTIAMTGLDQNMMQKNLSMKTLKEAQKNIFWFSIVMVLVNVLFISLGLLLYHFAEVNHISFDLNSNGKVITDNDFPMLAMNHFGTVASLAFILGLTAATFSSADSVLATLTTSFCIDFLGFDNSKMNEEKQHKIRNWIHIGFSILLLIIIIGLKELSDGKSTIDLILSLATYTYGPLIGLFFIGLFSKIQFEDELIPFVCLFPPIICYFLSQNSAKWFNVYELGKENIIINGFITIILLLLIRKKQLKLI